MPPQTLVVIPCFNEAQRLAPEAFLEFLRGNSDIGFQFVDDGSADGTKNVLADLCRQQPDRASVLSLAQNSGKAEAVRRGLLEACGSGAQYVGFWDADLSTPLAEIPLFLRVLEEHNYVMVLGARVQLLGKHIDRRARRHYSGRLFATCASLVLRIPVYDTQCGAKILRVNPQLLEVLATPFLSNWIFDVELIARLQEQHCPGRPEEIQSRLYEKPVERWTDVAGSKLRLRDFARAFVDLWRIYFRYARTRAHD